MPDLIGRTLGHYRIVEKIGEGGMGEVYRAHDERLDRDVAIKVLPEEVAGVQDRLERFEREAKLLASLNHPNIATLHGLEKEEGRGFLVMELVEGSSLAGVLARGAIPVDEALEIALQIANALETAHEHGIIHRDLKPANVMVDPDGGVKVLDFGLAKAFDPEASSPQSPESIAESPTLTAEMTRAGTLLGTAAYMSPEQARGKAVDKRADIWAFGCVLWEVLTGTRAFAGTTSTETLAAIIKDDLDWDVLPAETPAPVRRLLRRCLTKDPRDRLHDIADARIVLQSLSSDEYSMDETAASAPNPKGWRIWLPWGVAATLAVAFIAATMSGLLSDRQHVASSQVFRATIELPTGSKITEWSIGRWSGPMRNELALSPDGRTLVFGAATGDDPSTSRLFRRPMDRAEAALIPGTEGASGPFFSPDGRWIAFWVGGVLKKISLDGGLPITLAEYRDYSGLFPHMGGSWSLDGTIFIGTHLDGIQTVAADGGELEPLTVPDRTKEYGHRLPQILPGGRAVLFTVANDYLGDGGHIEVVSLDTLERRIVIDPGLDGRFLPTGHLLFLRRGTLMAIRFDPDRLELTGRPVPVLEGVTHMANARAGWANPGAGLFAVSDNGTLVFAPGGMIPDAKKRVVWVNRNGEIEPIPALSGEWFGGPRVSPDGRWIAFTITGVDSSLWVHDLVRETTTKLTTQGRVNNLSWMPDGERIVFGCSKGGVANLYWKSKLGNEPMEQLSDSEYLQQPGSWSPDGRYLAYVLWPRAEEHEIWLLDIESRETAPFLDNEYRNTFPDFSPDGGWLAYTSGESGRSEVWVTSFPGREKRIQVSNEGGNASAWSPDGKEIYYLFRGRLMVVEVTPGPELTLGKPRPLCEVPQGTTGRGPLRRYDISRDGSRFIFLADAEVEAKPQPVRQLQVVFNWFEELKRLAPPD